MAHGPAGHLLLPLRRPPAGSAGTGTSTSSWPAWSASATGQVAHTGVSTSSWPAWSAIASDGGSFPTTVDTSNRFLLDQHGRPWLGVGQTVWGIAGSLDDTQIEFLLDNCAAKGINLLLLSMPEKFYAPLAPNNIDNEPAFTGVAYQSPFNDPYWDRFDLLLERAKSRGITVLACFFYLGYDGGDDGWADEVAAANNTQMATYAGYVHSRYGAAENLMILIGHDKIPTATEVSRADAFLTALQGAGNTQLWTFGGWHPRDVGGTDTWGFGSEDWAASSHTPDFDTQYDYSEQIAVNSYTMWANSPTRPFLFFEGKYEQEQSIGIGNVLLREQMWAGFCAGACGVIFGNNPIWNFENNPIFGFTGTWESNLDEDGSQHLAVFASITATLTGWQDTVADIGSTFVTNQGTGTSRVAARFGADLGLVYHPNFSSGSITLDLTEFASNWATVSVTSYDPASGASTVVDASEATTNSTFGISAPVANSAGDRDWLFVVSGVTAAVSGSSTSIWPAWTSTATGAVAHTGASTSTWPGWTATSIGAVAHTGSSASTWPAWSATAAGAVAHTGASDSAWPSWSATATGQVAVIGVSTSSWPAWVATASDGGSASVTGTSTSTWPTWTATSSGVVEVTGTSVSVWPAWTASAGGAVEVSGVSASTWPSWSASAAGQTAPSGSSSASWPAWTSSATGLVGHTGAITSTWPAWIATTGNGPVVVASIGEWSVTFTVTTGRWAITPTVRTGEWEVTPT